MSAARSEQRPAGELPTRQTLICVLAWLIPGGGHWLLGQRGLAAVFFLAITLPYVAGLAFGGVKTSVNPQINYWLFLAELGIGGYTGAAYLLSQSLPMHPSYISYFPASELAQIYLSVAGMLNMLAVLDALSRAQTGGLPVFHYEVSRRAAASQSGS